MTQAAPGSGRVMGVWYLDNPYTGGVANLTVDMSSYTSVNGIGLAAVSISGAAQGFGTNAVNTTNSVAVATPWTNSFVMAGYANNGGISVSAALPLTQIYSGNIGSAMGCAGYHMVGAAGSNTYSFTSTDHSLARTVAAVFPPVVEEDVSRLDANNDGIADAWTVNYFSADPFVAGLDDSDPDGDTQSNMAEYIAGSDPTNGLDVFEASIVHSNGELVVSIPTRMTTNGLYGTLTRRYGLVSNTNLVSTNWVAVAGVEDIPATGLELMHTNVLGETKAYYRARTWLRAP